MALGNQTSLDADLQIVADANEPILSPVEDANLPSFAATNFRCQKQGRHEESPSKRGFRQKQRPPYLLLRPETSILVTEICFCSSEYEVYEKC
nr:hypothetical protein [Tanacetum cinerariifolium]